jgi:hypothetical protein
VPAQRRAPEHGKHDRREDDPHHHRAARPDVVEQGARYRRPELD